MRTACRAPIKVVLSWFARNVPGCMQVSRRPEPRGAEDIGTWYTILTIMSSVAVASNSAIIAFTSELFDNQTWITRVRMPHV